MIVPGCDAGAGYVAKIFSQINATFAGETPAEIDRDIANHIFLAALLQNQICVAVKISTKNFFRLITVGDCHAAVSPRHAMHKYREIIFFGLPKDRKSPKDIF